MSMDRSRGTINPGARRRDHSLELELGTDDVAKWYAARRGHSLINYGVSAGHIPMRIHVMTARTSPHSAPHIPQLPKLQTIARSPRRARQIACSDRKCFHQGALAEGMGINYTPGASHWESWRCSVWRRNTMPRAGHLRYNSLLEPETGVAALEEVIAAAAATGAQLHVATLPAWAQAHAAVD